MSFWTKVRCKLSYIFELKTDSDFFALLDMQLIFSAIHLKLRQPFVRLLFRLYQLLLPLQYVIWLFRIWIAAFVDRNITLAMNLSCGAFALTSIMIRYALMLLSNNKFNGVRAYINSRKYLRGHPKAHEIRQRAFRTNNIILLVLQLHGLVNIVIFKTFEMQQHEIFRIPDYVLRMSEPLFWFMHCVMQPLVISGLATYTGSFLNLHALLTGLRAEFQLVQLSFFRGLHRVEARVMQESRQIHYSSHDDLLWHTLSTDLRICVREHCKLLKYLREVQQSLSFTITVQYYTALLSLAVDAFFVSFNGLDFVAFLVVMFSVLLVFEWFYCCKLVEDLQAIHKRIGWTVYNDNWPDRLHCTSGHRSSLQQFRISLSIIMTASQRNLSFNGSDIVEVSWRSFSTLFKTSYSVLMFLIELRKVNRTN